jgi:hypothetical protein
MGIPYRKRFPTEHARALHRLACARGQHEGLITALSKQAIERLPLYQRIAYENRWKTRELFDLWEKQINEGELEGADADRFAELRQTMTRSRQ